MTTTTHQPASVQLLDLDHIALPDNVRELDPDHVANLAGSIEFRGQLVPVIVKPAGEGYQLVAGFHRFAAHGSSAAPRSAPRFRPTAPRPSTAASRTSPASSSAPR
jgi:hypothetical protein